MALVRANTSGSGGGSGDVVATGSQQSTTSGALTVNTGLTQVDIFGFCRQSSSGGYSDIVGEYIAVNAIGNTYECNRLTDTSHVYNGKISVSGGTVSVTSGYVGNKETVTWYAVQLA